MLTIRSYEDLYRYSTVEGPRVAIELVGTMGAVGLLLAIAGLYGLVAYNVSRENPRDRYPHRDRRKTGRRAAPGHGQGPHAGRSWNGDRPGDGVCRRAADERDAVQRRGRRHLVAYAVVVPCLFAATMLAAYVPARRASRIAPTQALRYE